MIEFSTKGSVMIDNNLTVELDPSVAAEIREIFTKTPDLYEIRILLEAAPVASKHVERNESWIWE